MPTLEAILRASGRVTGCRGESPDRTVQHGKRQRPPRRERLIRRARQRDHRNVSDPADSRGPAGLQRDAMGDDLAAPGQGRDDRIVAADAAAADGDQQIAGIGPGRLGDGCRIASRGSMQTTAAPAACALSAISRAVIASPEVAGILTMRSRGRRTFSSARPAARAISRSSGRMRRPGAIAVLASAMSPPARRTPCPGSLPPAPERPDRFDPAGRHRSRSRSPPAWLRRPRPRPAAPKAAAANRTRRRRDRGRATPSRR